MSSSASSTLAGPLSPSVSLRVKIIVMPVQHYVYGNRAIGMEGFGLFNHNINWQLKRQRDEAT